MTLREQVGRHSGGLSAVALVVTWSSGFIGAELGSRAAADPVTLLGWRFTLLSGILLAVAALRRLPRPSWRAWVRQGVLAVLCQAGYLILVFEGVSHGVHGGMAALIAALQPLLVATVAGSLLGERSSPLTWLGTGLGLAGVVVVVSGDLAIGDVAAWAYLLPTAGMLSLTVGTVLSRRLRPPETLLQTITMQSIVTAVLLMGAALLTGRAGPPVDAGFWFAISWLILLPSLGGYVLYVFVARTRGATVVSTLLYLTPPVTMLWVFLMFGEPVALLGLVGLSVSAVGVVLVLRSAAHRREPGSSGPASVRRGHRGPGRAESP